MKLAHRLFMAQYLVPQNSEFPYHITARTTNRQIFPLPLDDVWKIFEEHLYFSWMNHGLQIHSFVLMPNHFHLLASLCGTPLGRILQDLIRDTSKDINKLSGRSNHLWGGRTFRCEISNTNYFLNAYRYVYQNPIRAGLCDKVEDWPYSTLQGLLGFKKMFIPTVEDSYLFNPNPEQSYIDWLNEYVSPEENALIKGALSKKRWKTPKNQKGEPLIMTRLL